jgi:hypothetical protein
MSEPTRLETLKARAKLMGITYAVNIGEAALSTKIANALNDQEPHVEDDISQSEALSPKKGLGVLPKTKEQRKAAMRKRAGKLVRVRVVNMNPNKKDWEGEVFTVGNSAIGSFKKYVPFNTDDGWHIPQIILNHLQERMCQVFFTTKGPKGNKVRKGKLIKELSIEIMPPLTLKELQDLGQRQAMAAGITE